MTFRQAFYLVGGFLMGLAVPVSAVDFTNGTLTAVPVKDGKPPVIDGDLSDWDLSAAEPVYLSKPAARNYHIEWAVNYDQDALYLSATVSLPGRDLRNPAEPHDPFWAYDLVQVRIAADPALPFPLDANRDAENTRVAHISLWHNHETGKDFLNIARGVKLNQEIVTNPDGTSVKVAKRGSEGYVVEARVSWAALNSPGGKNPFKPGETMAGIFEALWIGGDSTRVAAVYNANPATFAFMRPSTWGRIEFAASGFASRRRPTMSAILEGLQESTEEQSKVGVPIEVEVPENHLKLSLNIVSPEGQVLREITGGLPVKKGKTTLYWDGRDAWGREMAPGSYKWAAYLSGGLKAEYRGAVGTAGDPAYQTFDGLGGWGGDHSLPIDVATDENAYYFLWPVAEAGRAIVKTDEKGKVLWRVTPFVGGGFGPFYAIAVDQQYVYLTLGGEDVRLVRLEKKSGKLLMWPGDVKELPLYKCSLKTTSSISTPTDARHYKLAKLPAGQVGHPDACGAVIKDGQLFISSYSQNKILVIDPATGKITGEIPVPAPRGLGVDSRGQLFAASYSADGAKQVGRIDVAARTFTPIITTDLSAPYDVAIDSAGKIYVSDLDQSQQIKVFDSNGKLLHVYGKVGGRPYQGKYDPNSFLKPAGLAIDRKDGLLIVEASIPKVISRLDTASGHFTKKWFGPGVYFNSTWPMPDDPEQVFYSINGGFALGKPSMKEDDRAPLYYWQPDKAGYEFVGDIEHNIPTPETIRASNGELYFLRDSNPHSLFLLRDGVMRPVAMFNYRAPHLRDENKTGKPYMDVWIDANGDGQQQPAEQTQITQLQDGTPLPLMAAAVGSIHLEPNGDLYFVALNNTILTIPTGGFSADGSIKWDVKQLRVAIPKVVPGHDRIDTGFRQGILGIRRDDKGNLYTVLNLRLSGKSKGAFDYPTEALAKSMYEGMGHSASFNAVKVAKYDPQGKLLWMTGRKATSGGKAGEMYHFWNVAGLVNDQYIAGASEWGQIYLYTADGFFVDALMNNPGDSPPPGPYTFGGETSGGRVAYFASRDELWAYCCGLVYRVNGIKDGRVIGERRLSGTVQLDRVYSTEQLASSVASLVIAPTPADPLKSADAWKNIPATTVLARGTQTQLAIAQLCYDKDRLYVKLSVNDESPLQNSAESVQTAFKGGDTAGIVLGPGRASDQPGEGDVRLMVAQVGGKPRLIAMKAKTRKEKTPAEYTTPASGTVNFEFVGEVPNAILEVSQTATGYTCLFALPKDFLEFDLAPGASLRGDIEIRLSGAGARGLQAVSRQYLFTPARAETTMVDDLPTESRLYPSYWGAVVVTK